MMASPRVISRRAQGAMRRLMKPSITIWPASVAVTAKSPIGLGSPAGVAALGKAILGRKVGDTVTVRVSDTNSYHAEILSIEKQADDGSAPLRSF